MPGISDFGTNLAGGQTHIETIMEYHAWKWTLQAEQDPRINMRYGKGAQYWLDKLGPELPTDFSFTNYPR